MKKVILEVVRDEDIGITKFTNRKQKVQVTVSDNFMMFAGGLPPKPKRMTYKGKLTRRAKLYINSKPSEEAVITRLLIP